MIMKVKEVYIKLMQYTKNVQTLQNLYKVKNEKSLKFAMYTFFVHINNVQTLQNI